MSAEATMSDLKARDAEYVLGTYARFPVEIVSGKGAIAKGSDGKEYIDLGSGIGVTSFGYCDDEWVKAVTDQLSLVQHTSNLYYTEPCVNLAELLVKKTGLRKVFFSNSGAEANECAIKLARKYAAEHRGEDCYTIVSLKNSFHGRTLTTLSATGQDHYHELFQPLTPGFVSIEADCIEELIALAASTKIAGIIVECVQGEGGVIPLDPDYLRAVDKFAKDHGIILIIDEVQTGNGRTGELYAYMNYGITPDIVTTAKGLGGGLPIGACIAGEKVADTLGFGDHGSTYGGNPVCAAGAVSVIERLDDGFLAEVKEKAALVRSELEGAEGIISVSGLGLMIGIETVKPARDVVMKCMEMGVLCLTAKNKVRLLPPLNIPKDVLLRALGIIKAVCKEN